MRITAGLLACLAAGVLSSALADPSTDTAPAAPATPNASAAQATKADDAAAQAAAKAAAEKAELDLDTRHFLAEGYKPEMHNGEQVFCRKETALGSRLAPLKNCGTIEQLKLAEQKSKAGVYDAQRQQINPTYH